MSIYDFGPPPPSRKTGQQQKRDVDIASGQQGIVKSEADIKNDAERIRLDREKFLLDLAQKGLMLDDKGQIVPRPGGTMGVTARPAESKERTTALAQVAAAQSLDKAIIDLEKAYYKGPGRTHGAMGVLDFLPTPANKAFDKAAAANRGVVKNAQSLTGGELNTAAEAEAALGPYIPSSSSYDSSNQDAFARLRDLRDKAWRLGIQTLGGIPDVNGNVTPLDPSAVTDALQVAPWLEREQKAPGAENAAATAAAPRQAAPEQGAAANAYPAGASAMNQAGAFGTPLVAADVGATEVSKPMPEEMQQEHQEWLSKHPRGTLTLKDYATFRSALDTKYGFGAHDFASDPRTKDFIEGYNGPGPVNVSIPPNTSKDERNKFSQYTGAAAMTPVGTAATTALAGTSLNIADYLLPDQMQMLREMNPNAAVAGDVLGSIGGTKVISKSGEKLTEKLLSKYPSLSKKVLADTKFGNAARSLLTDTTQGALYGGATEGDAGTGAFSGATGNVVGNVLGKVGGSFLRGLTRTPEADLLMRYGVPDMTIGQQLGGKARAIEDAATSVPLVGDVINARRGESLLGANEAAFRNVAGENIGYGKQATEALADIRRRAYDDALNNRTFDLDTPEFKADMANALSARSKLTDEFTGKFDTAIKNALEGTPSGQTGTMTGQEYQQAQRKLSGYKAAAQKPGFEQDYRDALGDVSKVLRDTIEAQEPELIPYLAAADKMYRGEKILKSAMDKARFDTLGLGADVFRPQDLTAAVYESGRKYPGAVPLGEFSEAMQNVLPSKMPDSGTAKRAMLGALTIGGLGAIGGAGSSAAEGGNLTDIVTTGGQGAAIPLATMAVLAAGGSKAGQRALTTALFSRPTWAKTLGDLTEKYTGKLSPGMTPLLVQGSKPGENALGFYDEETDTITLPDGSRIHRDGTPVVEKAKGGRVKPARNKAELAARYKR